VWGRMITVVLVFCGLLGGSVGFNVGECVQVTATGGLNARDAPCGNTVLSYPDFTKLLMQLDTPANPLQNCSLGVYKWDAVQRHNTGYLYVADSFLQACPVVCGDGFLEGTETCDDNNTVSGDGCSSTCQVELGYFCSTPTGTMPSVCSRNTDQIPPSTLQTSAFLSSSISNPSAALSTSPPPLPTTAITNDNAKINGGTSANNVLSSPLVIPVAVGITGFFLLVIVFVSILFLVKRNRVMRRARREILESQQHGEAKPTVRKGWYQPFTNLLARGPWQEHSTEAGDKYYYNTETGESRWTKLF